jgi:hypothetical protein
MTETCEDKETMIPENLKLRDQNSRLEYKIDELTKET